MENGFAPEPAKHAATVRSRALSIGIVAARGARVITFGSNAGPYQTGAQPGSSTHTQVPPPKDFHRASTTFNTPIGIFEGQSDIGTAVVPGSASYDPASKQYTIHSAGYNIWYTRDEFRYLWRKVSGDVSLAADVSFPDPKGYGDRKVVLVIRQDLDDGSKEGHARRTRYRHDPPCLSPS